MSLILIGFYNSRKVLSLSGDTICPLCQYRVTFSYYRVRRWLTYCFIPIFSTEYYEGLMCPNCNYTMGVTKDESRAARRGELRLTNPERVVEGKRSAPAGEGYNSVESAGSSTVSHYAPPSGVMTPGDDITRASFAPVTPRRSYSWVYGSVAICALLALVTFFAFRTMNNRAAARNAGTSAAITENATSANDATERGGKERQSKRKTKKRTTREK